MVFIPKLISKCNNYIIHVHVQFNCIIMESYNVLLDFYAPCLVLSVTTFMNFYDDL